MVAMGDHAHELLAASLSAYGSAPLAGDAPADQPMHRPALDRQLQRLQCDQSHALPTHKVRCAGGQRQQQAARGGFSAL